jgi:hypothetical protein
LGIAKDASKKELVF